MMFVSDRVTSVLQQQEGGITDDARHIPVAGRVKTDYGTFDIKLKRIIKPRAL